VEVKYDLLLQLEGTGGEPHFELLLGTGQVELGTGQLGYRKGLGTFLVCTFQKILVVRGSQISEIGERTKLIFNLYLIFDKKNISKYLLAWSKL
jgi:hypothetical protein